jgi:ribose transport system ATP-binding protein
MGPAARSVAAQWRKPKEAGPVRVRVEGLTGGPVVDASFALRPGEIVGVAGLLGSGRSSLLKLMFGALDTTSGSVELDGVVVEAGTPRAAKRAGIAYVPEDRGGDAAFAGMDVADNLAMAAGGQYFRRGRLDKRSERAAGRQLMADFCVKAPSIHAAMATLSGGNQQKVVLARWLRRDPRLILLDEPSQGVDVGARAEIWQLIRRAVDAGACALVVTSDLDEMAAFCDRALVMRAGTIHGDVPADEMNENHLQRRAFGLEEAS